MKLVKRSMVVFMVIVLMAFSAIGVNAASAAFIIDNDDAYGHSNVSVGFSTYLTQSSMYRGDGRTTPSEQNLEWYRWIASPTVSGSVYQAQVSVYLNSLNFTDIEADYTAELDGVSGGWYQTYLGTINQYMAPGGWYELPVKTLNNGSSSTQYNISVTVIPSSYTNLDTGADGVYITYYY